MRVLCIVLIDLIHMTNDAKVSMPVMADLLADRLRINNWVVAFKALITSHNLITLGNEVITIVTDMCIYVTLCLLFAIYHLMVCVININAYLCNLHYKLVITLVLLVDYANLANRLTVSQILFIQL